jgi:hypothetical protein
MAVDLSPLEQAAARVGLPGLKARVVPHDRRRGWWFRWGGGELLVSERVLDRCNPQDASALLVDEVLRGRGLKRAELGFAIGLIAAVATALAPWLISGHAEPWVLLIACAMFASSAAFLAAQRTQAAEKADDETVRLIGDATPLVRGLNEMDFEEMHLAGKVLPARPDLHRRAERLVKLHRLCEASPLPGGGSRGR